jgi:hypothetical protein
MIDLSNKENRLKIIQDLDSETAKARKQWSLRSSEVQGGRIEQYVKESLEGQFNVESVKEMPIQSSINIQKAIADKKATIYKSKAKRVFTELSDEQEDIMQMIYKDMNLDQRLNKANRNYIYQDQSIGMIVPKNGKLCCRIFKMHQIDAIVDYDDPETASGYIITAFDRTDYIQKYQDKKDIDTATGDRPRSLRSSANEIESDQSDLADEYQFRKYVQKHIVWTKDYNFMMNGLGEVIDPATGEPSNEIDITSGLSEEGIMPFFEIAKDKDFEYFVRPSNTLTDFTIQFNVALSDLQNTAKLSGYAVGILKAPSELQPQNQVIGAAMLLKLPTDDPDKEVDFSFASPNASIGEISDSIDKLLNYFTTSEGLGSQVINSQGSTEKYASGLDRFIAMINRIEAHQDDYDKFRECEEQIYEIVKAWLRVLDNSDQLDRKYKVGNIPEDSKVEVQFHKPEMVQTKTEQIANLTSLLDAGLKSKLSAIMELEGIEDEDAAQELLDKINKEKTPNLMMAMQPPMQDESEDDDEVEQE